MSPRLMIHAVILGLFCLGFGVVLALTDKVTADEIKLRAVEDTQNSLAKVIPPTIYDNNLVTDAFKMKDHEGREMTVYRATKGGKVTGVAFPIAGSGYAGEIKLIMGVDPQGNILGVRATAHKETPGLGDKIEEKKTSWITQFTGLSLGKPVEDKWKVKKDGGQFDQFSGATITPRGVVKAIREGLIFFAAHKAEFLEAH
jgi:electron transport complex protein RnfG